MIAVDALCALFARMYAEHWAYVWGGASEGEVDCSGAFVYAWRQFGLRMAEHSSNWMARKAVGAFTDVPQPGYAAFRWRSDKAGKTPKRWQDGKGDYYHVGLVTADGLHVDNAKGTKAGFSRDTLSGWKFAPLIDVDYTGGTDMETEIQYEGIVTTKSGGLNLRSGPGTGYPIIASLPKGSTVGVMMEPLEGWLFVRAGGRSGYVSANYITSNATESAQDAQETTNEETHTDAETKHENVNYDCFTTLVSEDGTKITLAGVWRAAKPPDDHERGD